MWGKDAAGVAYKGAFDCCSRMVKTEGVKVLLSGIEPRVMWITIGGYISSSGTRPRKRC